MAEIGKLGDAGLEKRGGSVIPFPLAGRERQVRQTVEMVMDRNGDAANRYWKQTIAKLRSQMASSGIDNATIEGELRAFAKAVFARIRELHEEDAVRGK